jgi:hypothetical protein
MYFINPYYAKAAEVYAHRGGAAESIESTLEAYSQLKKDKVLKLNRYYPGDEIFTPTIFNEYAYIARNIIKELETFK